MQHTEPIKTIASVQALNAVATGSWDKTLKYWDVRTPTGKPVCDVTLPERVVAMDVKHPLMVVVTADNKIHVFNLANPQTPVRVSS